MPSVDQRVVQMVFDKGNFESAVQSVIRTLDNLKKNLNLDKASSEFNKISVASKDVDFSGLANNVDTIASRFSNMGVIGMSVLNNLTNTAVNAGKRLLSSITSPIIEGGKRRALNIEQAKFQIEGLGKTWEDVSDDINYAVEGTAYGLDSAAKAAGQLLASSVETGPAMKAALRGISGVAAMTNSEYDDIAQVFTTVAGNGKVMASELNRLAARGINAAATLGKHLGKSEAEVREMVSKGKIDFATFAAAMDDAFGEHAKDANKTFTGALSNMKAALARIGADFATPAYEHMRDVLNSLRLVANQVRTLIQPLVTSASGGMKIVAEYLTWAFGKITNILSSDGAKGAMEQINRIIVALGTSLWNLYRDVRNIIRPISEAFAQAFGGTLLEILARAAEGIEKFTRSLALNARMEENLRKTFVGIFTILAAVLEVVGTLAGAIAGILSGSIVRVFGFLVDILLRITGFLGDIISLVKEFVDSLLQLEFVQTVMKTLSGIFEAVGKTIGSAIDGLQDFIYMLLDNAFNAAVVGLKALGEAFKKAGEWISYCRERIVEWLAYVYQLPIVQGTIARVSEIFKQLGDRISFVVSVVKEKLISAFNASKEVIGNVITKIQELIGQYIKLPSLQEAIAGFQNFIIDAFNNSKDIFEFIKKVVSEIIERVKELTAANFQKALDNFAKLRNRIADVLSEIHLLEGIKSSVEHIGEFFSNFADVTGGFFGQVKNNILNFVEWVKTKVSGITLGELIAAGTAGSFMAFFIQMARFIGNARKIVVDWASFVQEFAKIPGNINKILTNFADRTAYDKVKERISALSDLVKSIALLAGALVLLAGVNPERLITAAAVLGGLMTLLVALATFMSSSVITGKHAKNTLAQMGPMMLMLAGSLGILAVALRILANIKTEDLIKGLSAIAVAIGELVAASILITRYAKEATVGSGTILALAGAMLMMAGALMMLSLIPAQNLTKAIAAIGVLMTITALAARIAATGDKGSFAAIMGLALSMIAMIGAIKLAAGLSTEDFISGIIRMTAAVGLMWVLLKAVGKAGPDAAKGGIAIALMSGSFLLLGYAFKLLSTITPADISSGLLVLAGVTAIFAAMSAITRLAGQHGKSAGIAILAMSGSLILISGAIAILAQIDPAGLVRATAAVNSIIAIFALLVAATGKAGQAVKTITIISIAVAALAGAIAILSLIEPANLLAATVAIDSMILSFAALTAATSLAKGAYKAIILITAVVTVLAILLEKLASSNPEGSLKMAEALSSLIGALSIAMIACAAVGAIGPSAFIGVGVMAAVFLAILGLVSILGGIQAANSDFQGFLESTIPLLQAIGEGLGTFFGSIVNGFLSSAASGLQTFGESLKSFMDSFLPFIDGMKTIDDSALKGMETMIAMVTALASADFLNRITQILGGDSGSSLDILSEKLPKFGEALQEFSKSLGDTDAGNLEKAALAGKALAEMSAALPKQGGLSGLFGTQMDLGSFGENLASFGVALKSFSDSIDGANLDSINSAIEPTRALVELANMLPSSGGLIKAFTGTQDFAAFGENLVSYGNSIKLFAESLGEGVNYEAISKVMQPTRDLIEIAKTIENIGGLGDAITGADDLGSFGANLATFGSTFARFSQSVSTIDASTFDIMPKIIETISGFAEISKTLPELGGLGSFFTGDESLANLGIQLPNLAYGLREFANNMNGVDPSVISNSVPAVKALAEMSSIIPQTGGLFGWLSGNASAISDFGNQIGPLGAGLAIYGRAVTGLDVGAIQDSVPAVQALKEAVQNMPGLFETLNALLTGAVGLDAFPIMAASIGNGIRAFSQELSGVDVSSAQQGAEAAEALGQAISSMPGVFDIIGNFLAELTGNSFADCCRKLAEGIREFSNGLDGVSIANIQNGIEAINAIRTVSENTQSFSNLQGLGESLKSFGQSFHEFYSKMTEGVDSAKLNENFDYLTKLSGLMQNFSGELGEGFAEAGQKISQAINDMINSLTSAFDGNQQTIHDAAYNLVNQVNIATDEALATTGEKFNGIGEQMVSSLVNSLYAGGDQIGQAVLFIMQWAIDTINGKIGEFQNSGKNLIDSLAAGMTSGGTNVRNAVEAIMLDSEAKIRSHEGMFQTLGKRLMSALASGVSAAASLVRSAVQAAINSSTNGISTTQFYNIGRNCGSALAQGLSSKILEVQSAASRLASAASLATKATAKINSPSKVFVQLGAYMAQGLANGLVSLNTLVEERANSLASSAINAVSIVADTIDEQLSDIEYQPKITPVVDYASLQTGLGGINSMFGSSYGLNMANSAFNQMNANSLAAWRNQNGIETMVSMLDSRLDNLTDAMYEIAAANGNTQFALYMDGKEFASTVARPMNRALGSIYKRGGIT